MRLLLALAFSLTLAAPAPAAQFTLGVHNFTLPDGFTIEVAAPSSLVPRPMEADFDEQGRLYVTDSSGSNDKVTKQLADKPHRILRLEDTDGDGVFDNSVVFADKMMFPEGALWHDGSLYVSAPPSIWKLTDTNSDGVADVRVEWFKGNSLGGCANDLHGPYLGPDGWIYWCKGGFERQTNILGNGKTFISRASHIYRARPDGTGLEPIMTGGMDNPVGLAWSAEGELFLSGTFFQHPAAGRRDGLIHVIYGGVYGKENDALDGHPRTGELLPIMTHLGPAAPAGLARYESAVFGSDYQNNLFCAQFNLHKISRHILQESGSTFATSDSDFLVSDNPDFHPTDVFEDADGSLLVIDTGGWYKLCCPTSQLPKPDVLGAIYRIRGKDAPVVHHARGRLDFDKAGPDELVKYLDDARPVVVKRAVAALGRHGDIAVEPVAELFKENRTRDWRQLQTLHINAIWALTRIPGAESRLAAQEVLLRYSGTKARVAALNSAALRRAPGAYTAAFRAAGSAEPHARRAALTVLGRIKGRVLPEFASGSFDRALEHALIYALLERADPDPLTAALASSNPHAQRACLIALDQMPGGNLKPEQVIPLLASTNALLKQTANWIISHHPEWGDALAQRFDDRLRTPGLSKEEEDELVGQLVLFASSARVQQLCAEPLLRVGAGLDFRETNFRRDLCLRAINGARLRQTPEHWVHALETFLQYGHLRGSRMNDVIPVVRNLSLTAEQRGRLLPQLTRIATSTNYVAEDRLEAAATCQGAMLDQDLFNFAKAQLSAANFSARTVAALALTKASLTEQQLLELAVAAKDAGPLETPKLLPAFARATNESVGLALVAALGASKSLRSLRAEQVRPNLTNFPATVRAKADELLTTLNTDTAKQKARLDELSLHLKSGDVRRGQAIFNSQKAACATCHAIGYLGGNLGPDLTRIGQIRTERDLLEALVFPSASFVRSFEPMLVVTKSGEEHSGVLRRDAPEEVVLATGVGVEVRLARADLAEMRPGTVSVMPAGLDEQLTREELADLIAFLKATKW